MIAAGITRRPQLFTSLRLEMVLSLAVLGTMALTIAVSNVLLIDRLVEARYGAYALALMIVADVAAFVLFAAYKIRGLVLDPLDDIVAATEAIASGDLSRRAPAGSSSEFARLSASVNRMTTRLLEEQAQRAHLEKVASVGRLAAGVAHEVGNPLGAIHGYTHLIRRGIGANPELVDVLEGIERESARIDRIMRGMLDYARPRRRTGLVVDVNAAVHRVLELLGAQGVLRGLDVRVELGSDLPEIAGDPHDMDQVLVNLLLNAADALEGAGRLSIISRVVPFGAMMSVGTRRGDDPNMLVVAREQSARVRAWLSCVGAPDQVIKLVVADSGPGVPWADSERIFDPFFTTKDPGKGTGLGLAVVARIVEGLGGTVWVREAREGGAAFTILLPVASACATAAARCDAVPAGVP